MSIYSERGYENREDYLANLAREYDLDVATVLSAADILGSNEDFDGLITTLEDLL